ncbi:MAG: pepN [Gammaproteobacteria bacterium]|jgi:aminopeptidase N|nr:pepN [Gammaproteobacteria bacterium]
MDTPPPQEHRLADYTPSEFLIDAVFLHFDLHETHTRVKTVLKIRRRSSEAKSLSPLVLDGVNLKLINIALDTTPLSPQDFTIDDQSLTVFVVPNAFTLETEVEINPQENKALSGLYLSGKIFCTQCESQGFRRITYFLDRPDILTHFTTTITAHKASYPVLLANGNLTDSQTLSDNRQWVKWEDPTLKPCYLFALVAGNLDSIEDTFITQSNRSIKLNVYVEPGKREQATYAMSSLKEAMRWDEVNYGREYDLAMYMIVAVGDFNFGAMENKGLNIFNDKYIFAKQETATDDDFLNVKLVVGHEYFHNWSGNRVTVRDWFQITLKEGLTVFREQQFTADNTSSVVARIRQVKHLKEHQFPEDAGPMAHPIYPDSYMEINNFYTQTVYEKGAEVIRMIHTMLGRERFRLAMDLYFSRNDGHAVTVEDFVKAMEDGGGIDLTQFRRWYKQAGTPVLTITDAYLPKEQIYLLTVTQDCAPTQGQAVKELFHIPLSVGLLDSSGCAMDVELQGETVAAACDNVVLNVTEKSQTFKFVNVASKPIPSLLRDFSAPVKLVHDYSDKTLIFLMAHDTNLFNRWQAGQMLTTRILVQLVKYYQEERIFEAPTFFYQALASLFDGEVKDPAFVAEMLTLPTEAALGMEFETIDVEAIHAAHQWLKREIAMQLLSEFMRYYREHQGSIAYPLDPISMGQRRLKNLLLSYMATLGDRDVYRLCWQQFETAHNMTDTIGALTALNHANCEEREVALGAFYQHWQHETLIVDKWLSLQAQSTLPNTLAHVRSLTKHPAFDVKNPNRVRSLLSSFAIHNPVRFHDAKGGSYKLMADFALEIDQFNPNLSSKMAEPLVHWKKYDDQRQGLMRAELERIRASGRCSTNLYEIVEKGLR